MAGTLPGVEAARRRRIHHRGGAAAGAGGWPELSPGGGCTRRPVFCLFVSSFDTNPLSSSSLSVERREKNRACEDEKLGKVAREAKQRLDERLRAKTTSHNARSKSELIMEEERIREVRKEVLRCGKNRVMRWASKLKGWKATEQEECAVCLERLKVDDKLVSLPCAHRFHSSCLMPWLLHHAHCPCCRAPILP